MHENTIFENNETYSKKLKKKKIFNGLNLWSIYI